jgi:hypothetical protein
MSYRLDLTSTAEQALRSFPPCCRHVIGAQLRLLAAAPSQHSHSAVFPYLPKGRVSHAHCEHLDDGILHRFSIRFEFSRDEEALIILVIGHTCHDSED